MDYWITKDLLAQYRYLHMTEKPNCKGTTGFFHLAENKKHSMKQCQDADILREYL